MCCALLLLGLPAVVAFGAMFQPWQGQLGGPGRLTGRRCRCPPRCSSFAPAQRPPGPCHAPLRRRQEAKERPAEEPAAEEAEGEEAEAAEELPKQKAPKASKAAPPPKLDDAASWPSIGGAAAAPAPVAASAAAEEEEEEEDESGAPAEAEDETAVVAPAAGEAEQEAEPAQEAAPAAAAEAAGAKGDKGAVAVKLSVTDDGSVSLALSA